jgi:hypothetical protein
VVVGLAEAVATLEREIAERERDAVLVLECGRVVTGAPGDGAAVRPPQHAGPRPARELDAVGLRQVAGRLLVAGEALRDVHVADDARRRVAARLRVLQDRRRAERVVVMAVGVDDVAHGRVGELAHF